MIREVSNYNMIAKHLSDVILSSLVRKRNGWFTYHYIFSLCRDRRIINSLSNSHTSNSPEKDKSIRLAFFSLKLKRSRKGFEQAAISSIIRPKVRSKNRITAPDRTVLSLKNMYRLAQKRNRWLCYEGWLHFNLASWWRRIKQVKQYLKFWRKTRRNKSC